ncbi:MAG: hypothetical protein ACI8RY_001963, partial [Urechidicola sp.]
AGVTVSSFLQDAIKIITLITIIIFFIFLFFFNIIDTNLILFYLIII